VEAQLQPLLDFLLQLGLEAQHAARMSCVYPELLLASVAGGLQPLVDYLTGLGCSSAQVARLLLVRACCCCCVSLLDGSRD
jgi:mTERF domain-containing protein